MNLNEATEKAAAGDVEAMLELASYYSDRRQVNEAVEWADQAAALNHPAGMYRAAVLHHMRLSLILQGGKPFWSFLKDEAKAVQENAAVLVGLSRNHMLDLEEETYNRLLSVLLDGIYCEALACYMGDARDLPQAVHLLDGMDSPREKALCGVCRYELGQTDAAAELLKDALTNQEYFRKEKLPAEENVYTAAAMICAGAKRREGHLDLAIDLLFRGIDGVRNEELKNGLHRELARYKKKLFGGWKYA